MYEILSFNEKHKVVGEIYKITNLINNKIYIGQTRSHRLNHKKYRPFGYIGRFKDHFNEANSNKKAQCRYLNSAILKYGIENFMCELLETCEINELNRLECEYINNYSSLYPNGYNLTKGGKNFTCINGKYIWKPEYKPKINKNLKKSDYTKNLISENIKKTIGNKDHRIKMMKITQQQHLEKKYSKFENIHIDENEIDNYIRVLNDNKKNEKYVRIEINKKRLTTFYGKHETINEIIERAKQFLLNVKEWQRNQIAGNSLELETTTPNLETELEELG